MPDDALAPRDPLVSGSADPLAQGAPLPVPDEADLQAVTAGQAIRQGHRQAATFLGHAVAPGLTDWLTQPHGDPVAAAADVASWLAPELAGAKVLTAMAPFLKRAPEAVEAATGGIRAYHGSPHDFDRFDMSKIGTGEGAQVYGHGLYFAESPDVAEAYRTNLTSSNLDFGIGRSKYNAGGVAPPSGAAGYQALDTFQEIDSLMSYLHAQAEDAKLPPTAWRPSPESRQAMVDHLRNRIEGRIASFREQDARQRLTGASGDDMRALAQFYDQYLRSAKPEDITLARPGRVYTVDIKADPEKMLDWDRPVSEQPHLPQHLTVVDAYGDMSGADLVRFYENRWGPAALAATLKNAGIPGIRYLDRASRGSGQGTRNYVVFDDRLIDILKKYGIVLGAIPAAGFYHHQDDGS